MQKISAILVVLDRQLLDDALCYLNFNAAQLEAVIIENGEDQYINFETLSIPTYSFDSIEQFLQKGTEYIWLLHCSANSPGKVWRMAKFLLENGVPRDNIVNFIVSQHINRNWLGNLKYIETHPIDFFATGISYAEVGLDLARITGMHGVNLAGSNQDLRQAFLTAQYVFERQKGVKFVLIGLAPYSFRYDCLESFSVSSRNLQYLLALKNSRDDSVHGQLLRMLIGGQVKQLFSAVTEADADPNFVELKKLVNREMRADIIVHWENELRNVTKTFRAEVFERNVKFLEQYIRLCLEHGAKPIGIVLPFAPILNQKYPRDQLSMFRRILKQLSKAYEFDVIDLFDLPLGYKHFYNLSHLNSEGARLSSILINYELFARRLKPIESMLSIAYADLYELLFMIEPSKYNTFAEELYRASAEKIRCREKIKIAFVGYDASMWCGDDLYRLFDRSERYEVMIFFCLRRDKAKVSLVVDDFHRGVEQLKARGLNVVAVDKDDAEIPKQDVLIFLTPYPHSLPKSFQLQAFTAETLIAFIPYGANIIDTGLSSNHPIRMLAWRSFFYLQEWQEKARKRSRTGVPFSFCSGLPKFDYFFQNHEVKFDWKETQPNSTRIIYAPHWTIDVGMKCATFQFNHEFFYEYAKAHPETSWIFKPHPNLLFSAVQSKVFPSDEAFEEYLRKWDELPNARVVTGGYYQPIFATSDGMILDSSAFVFEYQYTHKPLLFLTREMQTFLPTAEEIMKTLYRVDGRDFDGIAKFIDEVLIKKHDTMSEARREFFDEHLNYVKRNGMLASEFIFKSIDGELGGESHG